MHIMPHCKSKMQVIKQNYKQKTTRPRRSYAAILAQLKLQVMEVPKIGYSLWTAIQT